MLWPPLYYPVYQWHVRLPEPSLHANPLLQTPPVVHWEGLHTIRWLLSNPQQLTSSVLGDCQPLALKDHDSGKLIPHLPVPPVSGPFLLDTLQGSKYQVLFHQPNVLLDGQPVGVFQWGIAPPWRCVELRVPLPRSLRRAGRAAAIRGSKQRIADGLVGVARAERELRAAEQDWAEAESLKQGMQALERADRARKEQPAAEGRLKQALDQEGQRLMHERNALLFDEEAEALARKGEADRLRRRGLALAERQDEEGRALAERAVRGPWAERAAGLTAASERHERARATREASEAWAVHAREQEAIAAERREAGTRQRAALRSVEEAKAAEAGGRKKENPVRQATGESNAGFTAPSLLAHVPFPCTVEIQVSWEQIGRTWSRALIRAAADALKYYVGFVIDGVLAPGRGKVATVLLDLVKSGINEALIDSTAKFLTEGTWQIKLGRKLGPVKVDLQCEPDPRTGGYKWRSTVESTEAHRLVQGLKPKLVLEGHGLNVPEKVALELQGKPIGEDLLSRTPLDYAHGVPAVN